MRTTYKLDPSPRNKSRLVVENPRVLQNPLEDHRQLVRVEAHVAVAPGQRPRHDARFVADGPDHDRVRVDRLAGIR